MRKSNCLANSYSILNRNEWRTHLTPQKRLYSIALPSKYAVHRTKANASKSIFIEFIYIKYFMLLFSWHVRVRCFPFAVFWGDRHCDCCVTNASAQVVLKKRMLDSRDPIWAASKCSSTFPNTTRLLCPIILHQYVILIRIACYHWLCAIQTDYIKTFHQIHSIDFFHSIN